MVWVAGSVRVWVTVRTGAKVLVRVRVRHREEKEVNSLNATTNNLVQGQVEGQSEGQG